MPQDLKNILIYHITDVANLPGILAEGGLQSDAVMVMPVQTANKNERVK
jgi:hypothetical protein